MGDADCQLEGLTKYFTNDGRVERRQGRKGQKGEKNKMNKGRLQWIILRHNYSVVFILAHH